MLDKFRPVQFDSVMAISKTVEWLKEQLETRKGCLVVMDCRAQGLYESSHVETAINVAIPSLMLRRLKKGNLPVKSLLANGEDREMFVRRCKTDTIVLYDEYSREWNENIDGGSVLGLLLRRMKDEGYKAFYLEGMLSWEFFRTLVRILMCLRVEWCVTNCFQPHRWFQQIPGRVSHTLRDEPRRLLQQQLLTDLSGPRARRAADQLRLFRHRVGHRPRSEQRDGFGREPSVQPAALLSRGDPAAFVSGLREGLHEPGHPGGVWHQVHLERDSQSSQHVRERRGV